MKIALVDDTIYGYASGAASAAGGAERYMWLQTRALAAHGWAATVGTWTALQPGERVRIEGVDFVGVERGSGLRAVSRFLSSERPDWCHWFGAGHLLGPAVAAAKLVGTRTVFSAQFDLDVRPRQALARRRRLWPLYALGLFGSNRIFLQHRRQYADLSPLLKSKAHVVPGVVDLPLACTRHAEREPYVAWVGLLRQPKRPDLLIEIARRLPGVNFVVCGGTTTHRTPAGYGDGMIAEFQRLPNIHYLGHVSPAQAIKTIAGASLLLSTSEREGFPSVFLEAWANATPVVSLTVDPDDTIASSALGRVSGSVEQGVKDLGELVGSPQLRQELADRCREHVAKFHSGAAAVAVVERVLAGSARGAWQPSQSVGGL